MLRKETIKMKKLLLTAAAAITLVSPLISASAYAQTGSRYGQQQPPQTQPQPPAPQYQNGGNQNQNGGYQNRDDRNDNRDVRRDERGARQAWRDDRHDARWDDSRHNGYYLNNRWHNGPPPARYGNDYNRRHITLGYKPWQRGQHLGYYNNRYAEVDYRTSHLNRPPRGYHWVRDDGGDYLLAAIAGGLIAQVIINSGR
jgi:Ni/Co efflux regulator RcnB